MTVDLKETEGRTLSHAVFSQRISKEVAMAPDVSHKDG